MRSAARSTMTRFIGPVRPRLYSPAAPPTSMGTATAASPSSISPMHVATPDWRIAAYSSSKRSLDRLVCGVSFSNGSRKARLSVAASWKARMALAEAAALGCIS
ncbi:Uncharacterised protein [Bordetella pertussis]|nr:Uncharacterised protein [Bordetella pertussis]